MLHLCLVVLWVLIIFLESLRFTFWQLICITFIKREERGNTVFKLQNFYMCGKICTQDLSCTGKMYTKIHGSEIHLPKTLAVQRFSSWRFFQFLNFQWWKLLHFKWKKIFVTPGIRNGKIFLQYSGFKNLWIFVGFLWLSQMMMTFSFLVESVFFSQERQESYIEWIINF